MKQKKKKPKKPEVQNANANAKSKGNFGKVPFQKMPLDSMIGSKSTKSSSKSLGIFTKRG